MKSAHKHKDVEIRDGYEIKLDYNPEEDDLGESLAALSEIIKGHSLANSLLVEAFDQQVSSTLILEDIQAGSIRMFVQNIIRNTSNEEIRDKGFQAFIRQGLVETREVLLDYISSHNRIDKREDISDIRAQFINVANRLESKNTLGFESMSDSNIAECLKGISAPDKKINSNQKLKVIAGGKEHTVNKDFRVSSSNIEEILLGEESTWEDQIIKIKIKQPDYIGNRKWLVQHDGKTVDAVILHTSWLRKFQNNELPKNEFPFPKDLLKVKADIVLKKDKYGLELSRELHIKQIISIKREAPSGQLEFKK